MSRRRVPDPEKKVKWTISIDPTLKAEAQAHAKGIGVSESVYVRGLVARDLERVKRLAKIKAARARGRR